MAKPFKRKPLPAKSAAAPKTPTDWSGVAEWYDRLVGGEGSEYHQKVVLPGVLRLLNPRANEAMVDVACGQGVLCRLLRDRGVAVTGLDASRELIAAARQRDGNAGGAREADGAGGVRGAAGSGAAGSGRRPIAYHVADARELGFLPENHFDTAACVLAIQNIHPIHGVFEGVARALKERGRFVVAMMHPAFRGTKETSWGWDQAKLVQFRRVDRYLLPRKTPIVAHPGQTGDVYTWTFHKPLESYVKAARNAGLLIDALEEWPSHKTSTSGPRAAAENAARKEIPMFLAFRAVKVAGYAAARQGGNENSD